MKHSLKIAVGLPTAGRPSILCETLRELRLQTRQPDWVVVCGTKPADVEGVDETFAGVQTLLPAETGLTRQRNAILNAVQTADIIVFFDDDFFPDKNYLSAIEQAMISAPAIVIATGLVLADGITGPGLTPAGARAILARGVQHTAATIPVFTGYGCNMALRLEPMRRHHLTFDGRLPLYGWQEDVDFSRRLALFGDVVQVGAAHGVHLGVKSGRASGVRLGYSQIVNPLYLSGKRSGYPYGRAIMHMAKNLVMNALKSPRPEPYVDRRGRLRGNLVALSDVLRGRLRPERILEL